MHAAGGYSAVLIPSERTVAIKWEHMSATCAMATIGELGVMSTYFPDISRGFAPFENHCRLVSRELKELRKHGARFIVLGCDANVELEPNCDNIPGDCAITPNLLDQEGIDRRQALCAVLRRHGLLAANTFCGQDDFTTRQPWGDGRRTQLDYIFSSRSLHTVAGCSNHMPCLSSDHFPVFADGSAADYKAEVKHFRASSKGWKPTNEESLDEYRRSSLNIACVPSTYAGQSHCTTKLPGIQNAITTVAHNVMHTTKRRARGKAVSKPEELRSVGLQIRMCRNPEEKRQLRKTERKMRATWK